MISGVKKIVPQMG